MKKNSSRKDEKQREIVGIDLGDKVSHYAVIAPGNKRVWRGVWTSGSLTTDELTYWGVTSQKLGTYIITVLTGNGSTAPQLQLTQTATNYYFGGKLIKNASGYLGADRLGSVGKYYPYGQEKPSATTNATEKFTGYFRDSETGLDYAVNRYHASGTGRFTTPDPYLASISPSVPSSWNRYTYVEGDTERVQFVKHVISEQPIVALTVHCGRPARTLAFGARGRRFADSS